jgi:hypothetical protein
MAMLTMLLALLAGSLSGTVTGGLVSWWLFERRVGRVVLDQVSIDPDVERQIAEAAAQWAAAHHRPGAAPLVADKLRLAYVLNQRRTRRRHRRWWR